jgi:predicted PurR-regulated permease PerM
MIQFGPGKAVAVAVGYLAINVIVGNVIEPRITGQGLGLSTLVVFVSLVFWGWVLGTTGMLLSVPLTMTLKIALESRPDSRWVAALLAPAPEKG